MSLTFGKINRSASFNPTTAFPLDARSYFESYETALAAAKIAEEAGSSNTTYYYGETLCVYENSVATLYIIQPATLEDGSDALKQVGSVPIGDELSIKVVDGKIQLNGFGTSYYAYNDEAEEGEDPYVLTQGFIAGLEPKVRLNTSGKYELAWYQPNPTTVEGLSSEINSLKQTVTTMEGSVTNLHNIVGAPADPDTEGSTSSGLVAKVEALEAFDETVYTKEQTDQTISTAIGKPAENDVAASGIYTTIYTKTETNSAIASAVADAQHMTTTVVTNVNTEDNTVEINGEYVAAQANILYLYKANDLLDSYQEYVLLNSGDVAKLTLIGDTSVNLNGYATTQYVTDTVAPISQELEQVKQSVNNKADSSTVETLTQTVNNKADSSTVATLSEEVAKKANTADLDSYVLKTTLETNYITKTNIESTYVTKDEVTNAKYVNEDTLTTTVSDLQTEIGNTYTTKEEAKEFAKKAELSTTYLTISAAEQAYARLDAYAGENYGLAKTNSVENGIEFANGLGTVKSLNVNKLVQTDGEYIIMNGGDATGKFTTEE